jgi:hypothetical protein
MPGNGFPNVPMYTNPQQTMGMVQVQPQQLIFQPHQQQQQQQPQQQPIVFGNSNVQNPHLQVTRQQIQQSVVYQGPQGGILPSNNSFGGSSFGGSSFGSIGPSGSFG